MINKLNYIYLIILVVMTPLRAAWSLPTDVDRIITKRILEYQTLNHGNTISDLAKLQPVIESIAADIAESPATESKDLILRNLDFIAQGMRYATAQDGQGFDLGTYQELQLALVAPLARPLFDHAAFCRRPASAEPGGDPLLVIRDFHNCLLEVAKTHEQAKIEDEIKNTPIFSEAEALKDLYSNLAFVAKGDEALVYKATVNADRPEVGLKKGDTIALRKTIRPLEGASIDSVHDSSAYALAKLSTINNASDGRMTDFFPKFYGTYAAPDFMPGFKGGAGLHYYQEMEFVDSTFQKAYERSTVFPEFFFEKYYVDRDRSDGIPNSAVFEFCLGEWAGKKMAGIDIHDSNLKNWGLNNVTFHRVYHIGDDVYAFPPGPMPVRIDFARYLLASNPQKFYSECSLSNEAGRLKTFKAFKFLSDMEKKKTTLFDGFKAYFGAYKIDLDSPLLQQGEAENVRHYFIPQELLELEL